MFLFHQLLPSFTKIEPKTIMIKRIVLVGAMLWIGVTSCTNKQPEVNTPSIEIKLSDALPLKETISNIHVTMFQNSSAAHFPGNLSKVVLRGDSIFVMDNWKDPGIYLYNSEGMLTNSYTKKGNGPDEFIGIVDFNVMPDKAILLDTYATSQRIFLDRSLSFLHKEEAEEQAEHFHTVGSDGSVWYDRGNVAYGENQDKLIHTNGKSRKAVLPIPQDIKNVTFASPNVFAEIANDTILYLPTVEPRLYKCHNGQAEIFCELDFEDLWPDFANDGKNENPLDLMRRISEEGKVYSTNMLSNGNDIAVTFFCKDTFYILMLRYDNLSANKLYKVNKEDLESLGTLVTMADGSLIFGTLEKLLKLQLPPGE